MSVGEGCADGTREGLTAGNQSASSSATVPVPLIGPGASGAVLVLPVVNVGFDNLLDVSDLDQHVLRFQVGVDNLALPVHVVKTQKNLLGDLLYQSHGDTTVLIPLNQSKQVLSENLENHADVSSVGSFMFEGVEELDDVGLSGVVGVRRNNSLKKLNLVESSFCVVRSTSYDFEGNVTTALVVSGKPDCREVTPSQLPNNLVPSFLEGLTNLDRVVSSLTVVLVILLIGGVGFVLVSAS